MSAVSEGRRRPQPIRTSGPDVNTRSIRSRMAFKDPAWSASPCSPLSRPLPMYPESGEERMKEHDKSIVERLEPRSRRNSPNMEPSLRRVSLRPISEVALPSPRTAALAGRPPLSAPLLPPPEFRRPTMIEETRNMLLHAPGADRGVPTQVFERRMSAPPGALLARNIQLQRQREYMRRRGLVGSYHPREADLMVIPVEYRRLSTIAPNTDGGLLTPFPQDGRLTIRVVIYSRGRKPVVLTRTFDLDELRATIPDRSPSPHDPAIREGSKATISCGPKIPHFPPPSDFGQSTGINCYSPDPNHHFTTDVSWFRRTPGLDRRFQRLEVSPVPMHLEYARAYLPVLAAIILSEIVRHGDIIELPLPQPRAWKDTVAYVYTGRVALTEQIRQNILYLGGKV
ncbi:Fc.00g020820.m01.CDS01 [Cosmosporella sp. VM-42]